MPPFLQISEEGYLLFLHVQPGASRNQIQGLHGDRLKLKIKAPPVEGVANDEVIAFLAKSLGLAKSRLVLKSGLASRQKMVLLPSELSLEKILQALAV